MNQRHGICFRGTQRNPGKRIHIWELSNIGRSRNHENDNKLTLIF